MSSPNHEAEPLRILTIDNGGLQALSILRTLKTVCHQIALEKNQEEWKAPHELFDVIAGIGTGGWLAILLGRYKLHIDQCMAVYIRMANAINPKRRQSNVPKRSANPVAISQSRLIEEVDNIMKEYELDPYLVEDDTSYSTPKLRDRQCYAFAVGVTKQELGKQAQEYHLFRTYPKPRDANSDDPNPYRCRVSAICAATAAAKCFMQEYKMGKTVYWDEDFPNTHNISSLALDEAVRIFGSERPLSVVLNVGPGLPTTRQIKKLRRCANHNATTTYKVKDGFKRALSAVTMRDLNKGSMNPVSDAAEPEDDSPALARSNSDPTSGLFNSRRSPTTDSASSVSSRVRAEESKHQDSIKRRLWNDYGQRTIYYRLAYDATKSENQGSAPNPYLDDIERPMLAMEVIDKFLNNPNSVATIQNLAQNWSRGHISIQSRPVLPDRAMSESPTPELASVPSKGAPDVSLGPDASGALDGNLPQRVPGLSSRYVPVHG